LLDKITKTLYRAVFAKLDFGTLIVYTVPGKIGYGTVSEALAYKLPFIFIRRDHFNEEPFLRKMLEV
jgi:hypothetical protein